MAITFSAGISSFLSPVAVSNDHMAVCASLPVPRCSKNVSSLPSGDHFKPRVNCPPSDGCEYILATVNSPGAATAAELACCARSGRAPALKVMASNARASFTQILLEQLIGAPQPV